MAGGRTLAARPGPLLLAFSSLILQLLYTKTARKSSGKAKKRVGFDAHSFVLIITDNHLVSNRSNHQNETHDKSICYH